VTTATFDPVIDPSPFLALLLAADIDLARACGGELGDVGTGDGNTWISGYPP